MIDYNENLKLGDLKEVGKAVYMVMRTTKIPARYEYIEFEGHMWKRWVEGPSFWEVIKGEVIAFANAELFGDKESIDGHRFEVEGIVAIKWPDGDIINYDADDMRYHALFENIDEAYNYKKEKEDEQAATFA